VDWKPAGCGSNHSIALHGLQDHHADSRGHGRSDNPTGQFSYPLMAADMPSSSRCLGWNRPFVAGYSDGGQVALEMAIAYPGLAQGYLIGGIYNTLTDAWRQVMRGLWGSTPQEWWIRAGDPIGSATVQVLQERHDPFHQAGYWKSLLVQLSSSWLNPRTIPGQIFRRLLIRRFLCGDRDVFCHQNRIWRCIGW